MIRVRISEFVKRNKEKIKDLGSKLGIVAIVVFIATILLSSYKEKDTILEDEKDVYKPTDAIISGSNIPKQQYEKDSKVVDTFLEYCNNGEIEEAYNLLTDECKKECYPTIEIFKENYYNYIFDKKREYNIQAWISNSNYTVYKIRYTNNMLGTGTYNESDVYQDYITLNKKNNIEKISIGSFIDSEECNVITKTDEIEATVINKKIYIQEEEYDIYIKNITDKTILLDTLESSETIKLTAGFGTQYGAYTNRLYLTNFNIGKGKTKIITIRFKKSFGSNKNSKKIEFLNVISDYDKYKENKEEYRDITNITINVGD